MSEIEVKQCPYSKKCGGCQTIGQPYEKTLESKKKNLNSILHSVAQVEEVVGMEDPYHYRNKVHWTFAHKKDGFNRSHHVAGIYAEHSHKVIAIKECLIEDQEADAIIRDAMAIARKYKMRIFDEDTGDGLLRHILIRSAHKTGQYMVVLVLASPIMPGKANFVKLLRKNHPGIVSVVINVNNEKTSMVLGEKESSAYGKPFIEDELLGKRFRLSSKSFYQVNSVQTEKLYRQAIEYAHLTGRETVIDAYCGIGTIGICAANRAKKVIGCELNADAVRDAKTNIQRNELTNVKIYNEDSTEFLTRYAASRQKADVIFLDPPRSGSTEEFLEAAAAASPGRIVYISCGPKSLARDLKVLKRLGYKVKEAKGFDLFPFTEHCEVCVLLTKVQK